MNFISRMLRRLPGVGPVSASNATHQKKARASAVEAEAREAPEAVPFSSRSELMQPEIERVLGGAADDVLARAGLRLALMRTFRVLDDDANELELKDLTACIQRLCAVRSEGAESSLGLSGEALAEAERGAGIL